jgi:hypothetical protein
MSTTVFLLFLHTQTCFQIFCTAERSEALQKVAKMPETTREIWF